jgi:hypothetical protein
VSARLTRARAIAARFAKVAATEKHRPGRVAGGITFGRAKCGETEAAPVSYAAAAFDALSDDAMMADLRTKLGLR